ncbi:Ssk2-type MAP kinase [Mytilinidion resinicola]|uniref:MAP kinase kinase kinase n=1 Tax=Mytilinidion resinicola TaxID=574789 RepID=A0A6A6YXY1_9PEZI|nr:Ssk2-type MAP kinase [Mytilinidion resinicola]KAF2813408.1 Ssk2-type MAP kinase [Mytilinidion resinicola]
METADVAAHDSGSGSSGDSDQEGPLGHGHRHDSIDEAEPQYQFAPAMSTTPLEEVPPVNGSAGYGWSAPPAPFRRGTATTTNGGFENPPPIQTNGMTAARTTRPSAVRTPSNAYAPARRPGQFPVSTNGRHRNSSTNRSRRNNPNAEYRAQEKAYVQRIRQENEQDDFFADLRTPSIGYSTEDSETDEESPSTAEYVDNDPYDQETLLYYGNNDMLPSVEELKIPANRERLEWHSMLASVLTGDVVKQEKKRLIGSTEQQGDNSLKAEIWIGVRAKVCGRTLQAQRRVVEDGRATIKASIEAIISFEIKGEAEAGQSATQQVEEVVKKIEKCENLYPTRLALETVHPRAASSSYKESCDAVIAWHNTTQLINTELGILKSWVGNDELDFSKPRNSSPDSHLTDDASFIDRILKEDGLKSLQGKNNLLVGLNKVINKAKATLIANASAFADRHLPPYIEELLTLINFPSRLVQEIIRMRLSYAKKIKDPAQQGIMMAEQMISQFQILLTLATNIKEAYTIVSQPERGWEPPPCIEENFDNVVLDALKFYFKMLNWKLSANKNTFKEAEILEQEWEFSNKLGRRLEGGDVEVAEQFSSLTSKSLARLTSHFEKELQRRPEEVAGAEMDKRYKQILDSVRVRQRKLFRFSRILTQRFENCTEYNLNIDPMQLNDLYDALVMSGHFLVETHGGDNYGIYILASPALEGRPADIQSLLTTCYHAEDNPEDPSNPYVLILKPEDPMFWSGRNLAADIREPHLDLKTSRLRLIADGSQQRLANANATFMQAIGVDLTKLIEQRANLPRVNQELQKIKKTAYKLSNTIMDSVEIIRKQTVGLECQELIQTCFAFATEFGQRSVYYMDHNRRALNNLKLTRLALDWVSFICDDCVASDRKTFRWAVVALEFAMMMTRGQNILSISEGEYAKLRAKVAGCMSLLISHFDIMGARSTIAAQAEKQRMDAMIGKLRLDVSRLKDDEESVRLVQEQWLEQLNEIDEFRKQKEAERQALGRVLEDSNEADRALTYLSSSTTNVTLRWQQGQFVGGGTFGSVYAAMNLDSGHLMAVKEIRLQDPQLIPTIVAQIRDEMGVLQVLDHPNIVSYYGIEPHRDKVYIFMEYCSGGSLAGLLEHGRIEDETVIMVYALQMLEGLAYLHESGVVHRDIKPENILLDHNGVIKFVDFGAAKVIARQGKTLAAEHANTRQGRQKSMTGTPMYMSPEVIRGQNLGRHGAVDIWSLGCVILEMATGRRPWASLDNEWAIMYNIAQGNPPQLPTKEQLSEQGIDFLNRCFERDPSTRASAVELLQHDWIMSLRAQLSLEPQTPQTPSDTSSSAGSFHPSRQNSEVYSA